jgi:hypothetical protein
MFWLYGPKRKKLKPLTPQLREGFFLLFEKHMMHTVNDPLTYFLQSLAGARQLLRYDVSDFEAGLRMEASESISFSYSGISLSVSRRALEKISRVVGQNRPQAWIAYLGAKSVLSYFAGEWNERKVFRETFVQKLAEQGYTFEVLSMLLFSGLACIECADWNTYLETQKAIEMISDRFDNNYGRVCLNDLTCRYYVKRRMSKEATGALPGYTKFLSGAQSSFGEISRCWAHAWSSITELLSGDFEAALAHLNLIPKAIAGSPRGPHQNSNFRLAYAGIAVERVRRAVEGGKLDRRTRRECLVELRRNLKNARKFVPDRVEALKFAGNFWWHAGSHRRALAYWKRSIQEGERLGAKVELAHTFMDAGKLLGEMTPGIQWRQRGAELYLELGISSVL